MAQDSSDQLMKSHIAALRADAAIQADCSQRVYDYLPRNTSAPYIIYTITTSDEWDTTTDDGDQHVVQIQVWDDKEGSKRVRRIMQRIKELLHDNTSFSLTDHNLVNCRRVSRAVVREGQYYQGTITLRAVTEETA